MAGSAEPRLRLLLAVTGLCAGLCYWQLLEGVWQDLLPAPLFRFVVFFTLAVFPAFALLKGVRSWTVAALRAIGLALMAAGLVALAGGRFEGGDGLSVLDPTGNGLFIAPFAMMVALALPFLAVPSSAGWRDYALLFDAAWTGVIKMLVAGMFLGLFWALYFLSDTLLRLVRIDVLRELVRTDWGVWVLSGGVVGLALAVASELEGVILTLRGLVLRLMRLLLAPVALVVLLFVMAALFQGIETVFRRLSAAGTLMAVAAGAVLLIGATLDRTDEKTARSPVTNLSVRVLAALLPVLAGMALFAIWLRVSQYGLTPERLLAAVFACLLMLSALVHCILIVPSWPQSASRLRHVNVAVALISLCALVLWFTPALNAQRLSAASQRDRILSGAVAPERADVWVMARSWGKAGQRAIAVLQTRDDYPGAEEIQLRIAEIEGQETRWQANRADRQRRTQITFDALVSSIEVVPQGSGLPEIEVPMEASWVLESLLEICRDPEALGCVSVLADFQTDWPGDEVLFLGQESTLNQPVAILFFKPPDKPWAYSNRPVKWSTGADLIGPLRSGAYSMEAPATRRLRIGETLIVPFGQ